jgi:hypothetical protein
MLTQHNHAPGAFDASHCRACARQAGLLDHYDRVQWEEPTCSRPGRGPMRPAGTPSGRCAPRAAASCWPQSPS